MPKTATHGTHKATTDRPVLRAIPDIKKISVTDLIPVLAKGLSDFKEKPSHILLLVIIYPIAGLLAARLTAGYDVLPLIFPLITGFALIGPLAALGLYELSRRREKGLNVAWRNAFDVMDSPAIGSISALGLLLMVIFLIWLMVAMNIYQLTMGTVEPSSISDFITKVMTTPAGWSLIVIGGGTGFVFAVVVLAISVVSFPMLLDKNITTALAVQTSIKVIVTNPVPMAAWGLIVAGSLLIGSIPFFIGLCVVMPVLGHATWHLYRTVVPEK